MLMPGSTVRVSERSHKILLDLSRKHKSSMQHVLDEALKKYQAKVYFDELRAYYRELKADPVAWAEEMEERRLWDATLMDGIDADERWNEDGSVTMRSGENRSGAEARAR